MAFDNNRPAKFFLSQTSTLIKINTTAKGKVGIFCATGIWAILTGDIAGRAFITMSCGSDEAKGKTERLAAGAMLLPIFKEKQSAGKFKLMAATLCTKLLFPLIAKLHKEEKETDWLADDTTILADCGGATT